MTKVSDVTQLRAENHALHAQLQAFTQQVAALQQQLAQAQARIAELEQHPPDPPTFVKANTPRREPSPRRKRDASHNRGRRFEPPTQVVQHALTHCPDCQRQLTGQSIARRRQVIDLPPPIPVTVTEHQLLKRYCCHCQRWQTPTVSFQGQVLGQRRFGVHLTSLIAYLHTSLRLPMEQLQQYLVTVHQLRLSVGAIVDLLRAVREHGSTTLQELRQTIRDSPVVYADETGWREAGQNGYVWSFSTTGADAVRLYHYDHSRAGQVARTVLGKHFRGHLVTDFYAAYNQLPGPHQRCWAHLLRDLHALREKHGQDLVVRQWAVQVQAVYQLAKQRLRQVPALTPSQRERLYRRLVERVGELGHVHAKARGHPCQALAKRLLRHQEELFQFVLVEGVAATNNQAERSVRPVVIGRKISGGSRSAAGSATYMALASLFGTWAARGRNPFAACLQLLTSPP